MRTLRYHPWQTRAALLRLPLEGGAARAGGGVLTRPWQFLTGFSKHLVYHTSQGGEKES